MSNQPTSGLPPSLIISSRDLARLEALLDSPALQRHPAAQALAAELARAHVVAPESMPADVVTMNSLIECIDETGGERRHLTLGLTTLSHAEVLTGLAEGEPVVTKDPDLRRDGEKVRAVPAAP